jgi:DNA-binding transcriptional LysR family regulator
MSGFHGMDINLLVTLGALLEEQNLTRAGERIAMSQPAMSGALARLRKYYDDELLVRVGRHYELSPLGRELLPKVGEALRQAARTLGAAQTFDPATSVRTFAISISDYALTVLIDPLLALLAERAPGVTVDFDPVPHDHATIESHLLRRDLVIAGAPSGIPGRRQAVFRDRFVCIASRQNPAAAHGSLSLADLAALPHAVGTFGPDISTPVDRALAEAAIEREAAVTVSGLLTLPFVVSGTDLVAFVPERLVERTIEGLDLRIVAVPLPAIPLVEAAHWHPSTSGEAGLQWLLAQFQEVAVRVRRTPAIR